MGKIIHISALMITSFSLIQGANATWPIGDPWEKEPKQDAPELSQNDEEAHVSPDAAEGQEEKE